MFGLSLSIAWMLRKMVKPTGVSCARVLGEAVSVLMIEQVVRFFDQLDFVYEPHPLPSGTEHSGTRARDR